MAGKSWVPFSSGFLATSVQEEEIKREVEATKKHIGRILNLSRQCQKRQVGRKNFPNKSLNVWSQNFFKLLMEMFFYLVDGFQVRIKNFIIFLFRVGIMSLIEILPVKRDKRLSVE